MTQDGTKVLLGSGSNMLQSDGKIKNKHFFKDFPPVVCAYLPSLWRRLQFTLCYLEGRGGCNLVKYSPCGAGVGE